MTTTTSLTTIPQTQTNGAPPDSPAEPGAGLEPGSAAIAVAEGSAGESGGAPPADPSLDAARRLDGIARREAKARQRDTETQRREAAIAAREKAIQAKEAELEAALSDPVKHYLDNGKDPVEVAKRFARPETEEQKAIRQIKEQLAAKDKAEAETQKQFEERQRADARALAMRAFVSEISPDECPHLTAMYEAHEIPRKVDALLGRPADMKNPNGPTLLEAFREQHGRNPSNHEIRIALEHQAAFRATKADEARRTREASLAAAQVSVEVQSQAPEGAGPPGISNQHAGQTSSAKPKPLSMEERRKKAREELTAALEAEAAARGS